MKIALVLCPSWGIETPHLGIALLVAALRRRSFEVEVCDFNIRIQNKYKEKGLWKSEEDVHWEDEASISRFIKDNDATLESFADEVLARNSRIVGFSIYNTTKRLSLELARRIKAKDKDRIIVLGGQQTFPKESAMFLAQDKAVDAVVIGEGDEILPELAGKVEKLKKVTFCPGILYKENGQVVDCGSRPAVASLDSLPFADFTDFTLASYGNPRQLPILSSRGCPYPCVFCSTKLFWMKFRAMSGERIFREIDYQLKKYPEVDFFTFNDHVIDADMQSLARFCELVLEVAKNGDTAGRWEKFKWRGAAVIRSELDRKFLDKMKKTGCLELEYGIESASARIRKLMRKHPDSLEVVERVIRDTYEAGISVRANFMFGFPGETEEDFQETVNFLRRNKDVFTQVHPSETFCHIDPYTYLFHHPEEFKVINYRHSLFWETEDGRNIYPERLRRHQVFCEVAHSLGIPLSPGGHKILLYKEHFLEEYRRYKDSVGIRGS